jgi:hypothetical protein
MPGAMTMRPRSTSSLPSRAAVNFGRRRRTRLTFATTPGVRILPARQPRCGPSATGSTSVVNSRFGSMPPTTTGAEICSPEASATPVTRRSRDVTAATSTAVRISTPFDRAAPASASLSAPGPPRANTVCPAAPPSLPALSASRIAVVPADHGPTEQYCTPRHAIAARNASVSNASATKSATAMGSTRSTVRASRRPRPRNLRPRFKPVSASPRPGDSMSGGVVVAIEPRNFPSERTSLSNGT